MCLDQWIPPQIHTALHEASPPSRTALFFFSLNVLESVQTIHLRVSTGAEALVQEIYFFPCIPQTNELHLGLPLLI